MMRILVAGLCIALVVALAVPSAQAYVAGKGKRAVYGMGGPAMCPPEGCPPGAMPMQMQGYAGPITKCRPAPMACAPMPCPPPACGPMPCPPPCPPPCGPMPCPPPCDSGGSQMAWY
jgi:hypothetical protein